MFSTCARGQPTMSAICVELRLKVYLDSDPYNQDDMSGANSLQNLKGYTLSLEQFAQTLSSVSGTQRLGLCTVEEASAKSVGLFSQVFWDLSHSRHFILPPSYGSGLTELLQLSTLRKLEESLSTPRSDGRDESSGLNPPS